jgi:hypothetical protein
MKGRQMINKITDQQMKELETLYPKWLEFRRDRVFRLSVEQTAWMGKVWGEIMGRRWTGGCHACALDAFSRIMIIYEREIDIRFYKLNNPQPVVEETPPTPPKRRTRKKP